MAQSRNEAALENLLGASNPLDDPQSRIEKLLHKLLGEDVDPEEPQSRNEILLKRMVDEGFASAETFYGEILSAEYGN